MTRFFAPNSFWNTPIGDSPVVDPRNDHYIDLFAGDPDGAFGINLHQWTIPVYTAEPDTPRVTVHWRVHREDDLRKRNSKWVGAGDRFGHGPGFGADVPIPETAQTDPQGDAHLAVVDWEAGIAWDMWGAQRREDGAWESNTGMRYSLTGDGIFRSEDFPIEDGDSVHFHGPSRAAGVPAIAGLIMYDEVKCGRIEHRLACATRYGAHKEFVFPAIWTDGQCHGGLPEGAVLQLDPDLDIGTFDLSPAARVVARALQEYGAVNVDAAAGIALYGEGLWYHPEKNWREVLDPFELKVIPMSHYSVLKLGPITHNGDTRAGGLGH